MTGVGVEFVGGPVDGRQEWIACSDPMDPPREWMCDVASIGPAWFDQGAPGELPPIHTHLYRREVSGRDDGPAWLYRWAGEQG